MKKNTIRVILIVLLLGTFCAVFGFSSQDGNKSGSISNKITQIFTSNIKSIQELEEKQKEHTLAKIESVIRKMAHFSIYTVIGLLLMGLLSTYNLNESKKILTSLIIGIIYATSDEIHQLFIPGRTGKVTDIMIDTMGILLGIFLIMLSIEIFRKNKSKR